MIGTINFGFEDSFTRVDRQLIEQLSGIAASEIVDAQERAGAMTPNIKPIKSGTTLLGTAITVNLPLGDNLMLYKALDLAQPGDVLVVNTNGNYTKAIWGELMTKSAMGLKLGGLIVDGLIRDVAANRNHDFPIFSAGYTTVSVEKNGPGFVNGDISCGGQSISPGDVVVGDDDGVVVIKKENIERVIERVSALQEREIERSKEIASGQCLPTWLDKKMDNIGLTSKTLE